MRKVLSVVLGVVLTALALTVVGASTASASTPVKTGTPGAACTITVGGTVVTSIFGPDGICIAVTTTTTPTPTPTPTPVNCRPWEHRVGNHCVDDRRSGPIFEGQRYNNCADYNRNNIYDIRRGDPRYVAGWDRDNRGIVCQNNTTIINNGDCTTYVTNNRTYGDLYNRNYSSWNNLRLRDSRHQSLTAEQRAEIARLNRDMNTWYGNWNQSRNSLQTVCNQQPTVQIVQVPTPAPVTVTQQAPAPVYSGGSNVPRGSVETGYVS